MLKREKTIRQQAGYSDSYAIALFQDTYEKTGDECWLRFIEIVKGTIKRPGVPATRELFEKVDRYLRLVVLAERGHKPTLEIMRKEFGWSEGDRLISERGDPMTEAFAVAWGHEYGGTFVLRPMTCGLGVFIKDSFKGGVAEQLGIIDNVEVREYAEFIAEIKKNRALDTSLKIVERMRDDLEWLKSDNAPPELKDDRILKAYEEMAADSLHLYQKLKEDSMTNEKLKMQMQHAKEELERYVQLLEESANADGISEEIRAERQQALANGRQELQDIIDEMTRLDSHA